MAKYRIFKGRAAWSATITERPWTLLVGYTDEHGDHCWGTYGLYRTWPEALCAIGPTEAACGS